MLGLVATVLVVSQMAMLALGYDPIIAMLIGGLASILWIGYAVRQNDRWILAVNSAVLMFALLGLARAASAQL